MRFFFMVKKEHEVNRFVIYFGCLSTDLKWNKIDSETSRVLVGLL